MKIKLLVAASSFVLVPTWLSSATVRYVNGVNATPTPPYTSWPTAATNIQDAIDAAAAGDQIVVTNGIYGTGGRPGTRVTVDKALLVRSVNGPQFTVIEGHPGAGTPGAVGCVYLTNGASLSGFTVTNGAAGQGGGVLCDTGNAVVTNCVVVSNSAAATFGSGGGVFEGTLNNCVLMGNSATYLAGGGGGVANATLNNCTLIGNRVIPYGNDGQVEGGGAYSSTLNNCVLIGNQAGPPGNSLATAPRPMPFSSTGTGGGAATCTLNNCTLVGNQANGGGNGAFQCSATNCIIYFNTADNRAYGTLSYCCTTPDPGGAGNITNDPAFVDLAGGNLRLQSNSPCINAGNNFYVTTSTDLDGNPRIVNGSVDMGAYDYQGPSGLTGFHAWLAQYGLPADGSADYTDSDGDGMSNWQEWQCGTNPTNALSVLRMVSALPSGTNVSVTWQSVLGVGYFLQRSTNLSLPQFMTVATNVPGQIGTTTYRDSITTASRAVYYRVGVGN